MRKLFPLLSLFLFFSITSPAAIFRIGYPGTAVTGVDFTYNNIAGAMTAASSGDTIQLCQQYWNGAPSAAVNVAKPLKFIGLGYFLDKNAGLQATNSTDANVLTINFNSGSSGSIVTGAVIKPAINVSNISFIRSRIIDCAINNNSATSTLTNLTFLQCFIQGINAYACCNYYAGIRETGTYPISNIYISNCFCYEQVLLPNSSGLFFNNVVVQAVPTFYSFIIKNNIFTTSSCPAINSNTFHHNLFSCNGTSSIPGTANLFNVNMNNVFVYWNSGTIAVDSQFVLKTGSPAIGAGLKNDSTTTNAGIFGGESGEIYRLSGIPAVPSIYKISAPPAATTSPFNITISVHSNN